MDVRRLEAFFHVAALGSFTRAASVLGTAQSALSRQVSALERDLGERLFHRTGRGVILTEAGHDILPRVQAVLEEVRRLRDEIALYRDNVHGEVALGILSSLSTVLVTPLLTHMREQFPAVRVRVLDGLNDRIDDWLANGRVDIAIIYGGRAAHRRTEELLFRADLYLIATPDDPLLAGPTVSLHHLDGLPMILPPPPNDWRIAIQRAFAESQVSLALPIEFDYLPTIRETAVRGEGYTILPLHAVRQELAAGTLGAARIVDPAMSRNVLLTSSASSPLSRAARKTMQVIRTVTAGMIADGELPGRAVASHR